MADIAIRNEGRAGRITLTRPKALNALTYEMCLAVEKALLAWRGDKAVDLVILDAEGDKAFCAGGDIAELYATGKAGDYDYGRRFWRDEYRMNALIAEYGKPVVSFLQGFTMGGGVGLGCHGTHRIVDDASRIAMPECGIGLVPDVGGSYLLARAPGRLGEYLGLTTDRMGPGAAIHAGFADLYIPEGHWADLTATLCRTGDVAALEAAALTPPAPDWNVAAIDRLFAGEALRDIVNALRSEDSDVARDALGRMDKNAPLSMACTVEILHRLRAGTPTIRKALELEFRFTARAVEHGDILEGIRAAIIDKDRNPSWKHSLDGVPAAEMSRMLQPLPDEGLRFHEKEG